MLKETIRTRAAPLSIALAAVWACLAGQGVHSPASADEHVRIVASGAESQFPNGIRFFADVQSDAPIEDIRVRYKVGDRPTTQYNYLDIPKSAGGLVSGEYFLRTRSPQAYIPPGALINFWFEVYEENGAVFESEPQQMALLDSRFEWESVQSGPVAVMYHGPVKSRAQILADKAHESLSIMGPITGADIETPIVITMYNNAAEMFDAVVQRSVTTSRELVTEGQAFAEENVVIVQGGDTNAIGTTTHEITHVLVGRATAGGSAIPIWLNEGLAEYGNLDQTLSYDLYLEWAIDTNRLTPLHRLQSFPGDSNLVIAGYGQSRSAVEFMVSEWGPAQMADLLARIAEGQNIEAAVRASYGFGLLELDNRWRAHIGADPYVEPTPAPPPTRSPSTQPTLAPYSLTPVSGEDSPSEPEPAQTNTPVPTQEPPTPVPAPTPIETSPPPSESEGWLSMMSRFWWISLVAALGLLAGLALAAYRRRTRPDPLDTGQWKDSSYLPKRQE